MLFRSRLANQYYFQFIKAAKEGGMAAVCASEHFAERVQQRAVNRDAILKMDVSRFIASFEKWAQGFLDDAGKPVIGATEAQRTQIHQIARLYQYALAAFPAAFCPAPGVHQPGFFQDCFEVGAVAVHIADCDNATLGERHGWQKRKD